MVTPEIVRVVFLRRMGMSLRFSLGFSALMISALGVVCLSLCLAAIWFLMRFRSFCVGDGVCISALMISRVGVSWLSVFKGGLPFRVLRVVVDKLRWNGAKKEHVALVR